MSEQATNPTLKWTTERPSTQGWYWLEVGTWPDQIVWYDAGRIYSISGSNMKVDQQLLPGVLLFEGARWSGPIPAPVEPDVDERTG